VDGRNLRLRFVVASAKKRISDAPLGSLNGGPIAARCHKTDQRKGEEARATFSIRALNRARVCGFGRRVLRSTLTEASASRRV
jgi:hypothetical protein